MTTEISEIPPRFVEKKKAILESLAAPEEAYTDLSPKGSVDIAIRDLIDEINSMDGIVTTSSCAGRISVFLEGGKEEMPQAINNNDSVSIRQTSVPGGKGMGGQWLFVSHDPVDAPGSAEGSRAVHDLLNLEPALLGANTSELFDMGELRLVRFQFEPMVSSNVLMLSKILHIMTASLHHAQPVLAAALNAGFRESGLQSLKALDDMNSFPMIAVRTAGLGVSSVVGFDNPETPSSRAQSLVSEDYLAMMLRLGNERFQANSDRTERFRQEMKRCLKSEKARVVESRTARTERKRREGLARQAAMKQAAKQPRLSTEDSMVDDILGINFD